MQPPIAESGIASCFKKMFGVLLAACVEVSNVEKINGENALSTGEEEIL